jgi:hypothetical protein
VGADVRLTGRCAKDEEEELDLPVRLLALEGVHPRVHDHPDQGVALPWSAEVM